MNLAKVSDIANVRFLFILVQTVVVNSYFYLSWVVIYPSLFTGRFSHFPGEVSLAEEQGKWSAVKVTTCISLLRTGLPTQVWRKVKLLCNYLLPSTISSFYLYKHFHCTLTNICVDSYLQTITVYSSLQLSKQSRANANLSPYPVYCKYISYRHIALSHSEMSFFYHILQYKCSLRVVTKKHDNSLFQMTF